MKTSKVFSRFIVLGLLVGFLLNGIAAAQTPKRFYIAPDDHTDYFWIADDVTYRQVFLTSLDYYLNKMDETQNNPADQQMRWKCDGSLWMWEFERNRSPAQFDTIYQSHPRRTSERPAESAGAGQRRCARRIYSARNVLSGLDRTPLQRQISDGDCDGKSNAALRFAVSLVGRGREIQLERRVRLCDGSVGISMPATAKFITAAGATAVKF